MRNIGSIFAIASIILLSSCVNEIQQSWENTLRVHDEVMLIMQENGKVEQKLNELIKRGKESPNSVLATKVDTLQMALNHLSATDEDMMDWMATIQKPQKGANLDSTIAYHKEREIAIKKVGDDMMLAAQQAEYLLKSLEKQ